MEDLLIDTVIFGPIVGAFLLLFFIKAKGKGARYWKWFLGIIVLLEVLGMGHTFISESANSSSVLKGMGYLATAFFLHPLLLVSSIALFITNALSKPAIPGTQGKQVARFTILIICVLAALALWLMWQVFFGHTNDMSDIPVTNYSL